MSDYIQNSNDPQDLPETYKPKKKRFLRDIAIVLLTLAIAGGVNIAFNKKAKPQESKEYAFSNINEIEVNASSPDVYLKPVSTGELRVVVEGDKEFIEKVNVNKRNSRLEVIQSNSNSKIINMDFKNSITLYIPPFQYSRFEINTSSGDITAEGDYITRAYFKSSSGDISLDGYKGENLRANTTSGNLRVKRMNFKDYELSASSGDIEAKNIKGTRLDSNTSSGAIKLSDITMTNLYVKASSGSISGSNMAAVKAETITSSGNINFDFVKLSGINFTGKSSSGNVTLRFADDMPLNISGNKTVNTNRISDNSSDNRVRLTTSSGKLKIE